jgi:3-oxoacyl-[acyl-carrier-protein] synthase-1
MKNRVVITGFGGVSATGSDIHAMWQALNNGKTGIDKIQQWDVSDWDYPWGAELKNYDPKNMVADRKLLKLLSRHDVIGLNAASQAIQHSQLINYRLINYRDNLTDPIKFNDRTGVYVSSPGIKFNQQYDLLPLFKYANRDLKRFGEKLFETVHPTWLLRILSNNVLAYVGIQYGFKGANQNITNHAVGGVQALGEASRAIKSGYIERAVVVAYEAGLEP